VTARLARREAALAIVALLAGVVAVTVSTRSNARSLPAAVGSYAARAGSSSTSVFPQRTDCGAVVGASTEGVAHPALPCGIWIYITFRQRTALTQVIAHTPALAAAPFVLTGPLAKRLGLVGVQTIHWSYAQAG